MYSTKSTTFCKTPQQTQKYGGTLPPTFLLSPTSNSFFQPLCSFPSCFQLTPLPQTQGFLLGSWESKWSLCTCVSTSSHLRLPIAVDDHALHVSGPEGGGTWYINELQFSPAKRNHSCVFASLF